MKHCNFEPNNIIHIRSTSMKFKTKIEGRANSIISRRGVFFRGFFIVPLVVLSHLSEKSTILFVSLRILELMNLSRCLLVFLVNNHEFSSLKRFNSKISQIQFV